MSQVKLVLACPHCKSTNFCKHGKEKEIQRYKCKKCAKTFRSTTGTSLHQMHKKHLVGRYIQAMQEGLSIRKAAKVVGISKGTAFAWRHKFLASLSASAQIQEESSTHAKGAKILRLPYSDKGRKKAAEKHTGPSLNLLLSDGRQSYITRLSPENHIKDASELFAKLSDQTYIANIPAKTLNAALNRSGKIRLKRNTEAFKLLEQKIESKTVQLEQWMERFQGVTTKHLQHYWHWFMMSEKMDSLINPQETFTELCTDPQCIVEFQKTRNL